MIKQPAKDFASVESRRSTSSARRMTMARRLYYFFGLPVLRGLIGLLVSSCRVEKIIGAEHIDPFISDGTVCAPCYWHQHHLLCSKLIRGWIRRGFKACFLFMIPKPFSRVVLAIGVPYEIPADAPLDDIERHRLIVQEAVMSLMRESKETLRETAV